MDLAGRPGPGRADPHIINAAVESRIISAYKAERVAASQVLAGPQIAYEGDRWLWLEDMRRALYGPRSAPTPRARPCCAPPRRSTTMPCRWARSPSCGAAAASSAPSSSTISPPTSAFPS